MNLFDRFILTLYSFALIVVSIAAIGVLTGLMPFDAAALERLASSPGANVPYLIVASIFLLISLRFFFSAFRFNRREDRSIVQRNDLGVVNISLATIQAIAERTARKVKGVRELKTTVQSNGLDNVIQLRVTVDGETPIPDMTLRLQHDVKQQVEAIAGVEIAEVKVVVAEVAPVDHMPVRTRRLE